MGSSLIAAAQTASTSSACGGDLFPCLGDPPYIAPTLTCDRMLQQAGQDSTQLYLALLLPELRPFVDRLLATPSWHSATRLVSLESDPGVHWQDFAVAHTGERLVGGSWRKAGESAILLRCDLELSDPRRFLARPGVFARFVDLRPLEGVCFLVAASPDNSNLTLYTINGESLTSWAGAVTYTPPWVRWGRSLCHIARRDRVLRLPEQVEPRLVIAFWGAEGHERVCAHPAPDRHGVQVFNLATGDMLYQLSSDEPSWRVKPTLGLLMHWPRSAASCHGGTPARFPVRIYPLATGAPLVLSVPLEWDADLGNKAVFFGETKSPLSYWSPRDPHRVRSLDFDGWEYVYGAGEHMTFQRGKELLLWHWGAATAVRVALELDDPRRSIFAITACNGAFFATVFPAANLYTLYMIPSLSEPTADGLPPPVLPHQRAPLVTAAALYRGLLEPAAWPPVGSATHAPLIALQEGSELLSL